MQELKLVCSSGEIVAKIGDRFKDHNGEWEIVSFDAGRTYSPSCLGGTPTVVLKPLGEIPSWLRQYAREDGMMEYCGDSVAACLLDREDGMNRSARGDILTTTKAAR